MDAKETWAAGNYAAVAEHIASVGEELVERAGVEPGMEVLDVATGTGNVALSAGRVGARVTGLDLVPELLDVARERAADAMLEVDWVEGDAERLPFDDGSFDRVLSAFGCMFAPDHARMAAELVRVCRPGGAIGMCNWTLDGGVGRLFRATAPYLEPPPQPPGLWGEESHVRTLLGERVSSIDADRRVVTIRAESPEAWMDFMAESFGPFVSARGALGRRWPELRAELLSVYGEGNKAADGTLEFDQEYLLLVARRR